MFRFVAVVNGDQLETLLLAAKVVGVTPELGVEPVAVRSRARKGRKQKRSTSGRRKPKQYPAKMTVKTAMLNPGAVAPRVLKAHDALVREYGTEPFEKRLAKAILIKRLKTPHVSGFVTALMKSGGLVEAVRT